MLNTIWKLAPQATSQDCLVGVFTITGDGLKIEEDGVYVDSWLAALIKALDVQGESTVDIPEESLPLRVVSDGESIALSFRNEEVFGSLESFKITLQSSVRAFLDATKSIPDDGLANPLRPGSGLLCSWRCRIYGVTMSVCPPC